MRPRTLLLLAGLWACQNDERVAKVDKPDPPPMQPILDAFAMPTATVEPASLVALTLAIAARTDAVDTLQIDQVLIDSISEGLAQVQANGQAASAAIDRASLDVAQQPIDVRGDGYLVITRICDGWGAVPVPDPANGTLQLTAGFTEQGLDPVVWGTLNACKYKLGERSIQIDGLHADPSPIDLRAYIGNAVTFDRFRQFDQPIVVDVEGRVFVDGVEQLGHFTFKIDPATRRFETLVPLGTGHVVAVVSLDRTDSVEVRSADGTFVCDVAAQRCTTPSGQTIEAP